MTRRRPRWVRRIRSELGVGSTHTFIAVVALIALLGASVAVGVALSKEPDAAAVTSSRRTGGGKTIDFSAKPGDGWKPFDPRSNRLRAPRSTRSRSTRRRTADGDRARREAGDVDVQRAGPRSDPARQVGDIFTVTLVNDGKNGPLASTSTPPRSRRTTRCARSHPASRSCTSSRPTHSGIWMYHCGTPPVLHHIGNGMYGAVIIDPPDLPAGRPRVRLRPVRALPRRPRPARRLREDAERAVGRGRLQRLRQPVPSAPIRVEPGQTHPRLGARRRPVGELVVPRHRHDLRHRLPRGPLRAPARRDAAAARRRSTCNPPKAGSSSSPSTKPGMYPFITHKLADVEQGRDGLFQAGPPVPGESAGH